MSKTYTLELTAEELDSVYLGNKDTARPTNGWETACAKMNEAWEQAKADREQADLRLPWRAHSIGKPAGWFVGVRGNGNVIDYLPSERVAKLMSAAPELLEAVKEVNRHADDSCGTCPCCVRFCADWSAAVQPSIDRALRKVETGIPEARGIGDIAL